MDKAIIINLFDGHACIKTMTIIAQTKEKKWSLIGTMVLYTIEIKLVLFQTRLLKFKMLSVYPRATTNKITPSNILKEGQEN